jgi:hypothetical protein
MRWNKFVEDLAWIQLLQLEHLLNKKWKDKNKSWKNKPHLQMKVKSQKQRCWKWDETLWTWKSRKRCQQQ